MAPASHAETGVLDIAAGPIPVSLAAQAPHGFGRVLQGQTLRPVRVADGGTPDIPPHFERPEHIRGIYLNAWAAGARSRSDSAIALASRTEINTIVIDIKDATGYLSYRSAVPLAQEIGANNERRIPNLNGLLWRLKQAGIYPVARIVVFKDPLVAEAKPEWSIRDENGQVWKDQKGKIWVNAHREEVWRYNIALAREAIALGFPEVQWDYVRFPDTPKARRDRQRFPGAEGRSMTEAIRGFLALAKTELADTGAPLTADVFGITTRLDVDFGIGQVWETFIDRVDAALPMVYPSHYGAGSYGYANPNAYPYEVVYRALRDAMRRSADVPEAGATIPWLQDFTLGAPRYGAAEVRAQIQAAYDAGIQDWILWNPGAHYTEAALAPAGGYGPSADPMMRVAGRLVPVSQRASALDGDESPSAAAGNR